MHSRICALAALAALSTDPAARAHHVETGKRAASVLERYEVSAESIDCTPEGVKQIRVLDDRHLIFEVREGKKFLGELEGENNCRGLWKYKSFRMDWKEGAVAQLCIDAEVHISGSGRMQLRAPDGQAQIKMDPAGGVAGCRLVWIRELTPKPGMK